MTRPHCGEGCGDTLPARNFIEMGSDFGQQAPP